MTLAGLLLLPMPVHQDHKDHAPASVKCGIVTSSDSRTGATDDLGKLIREFLLKAGHKVLFYTVVKDEAKAIAAAVEQASWTCDAVITNGGTALSRRDVTIPTLAPLFERTLPGFGEIFPQLSYDEIGSASMLSGAMAGVDHGRLVFCLPGSPEAYRLAMETLIMPELSHAVGVMRR